MLSSVWKIPLHQRILPLNKLLPRCSSRIPASTIARSTMTIIGPAPRPRPPQIQPGRPVEIQLPHPADNPIPDFGRPTFAQTGPLGEVLVQIGYLTATEAQVFLARTERQTPSNLTDIPATVTLLQTDGNRLVEVADPLLVTFRSEELWCLSLSLKGLVPEGRYTLRVGEVELARDQFRGKGSFRTLPTKIDHFHILAVSCNRREDDDSKLAWRRLSHRIDQLTNDPHLLLQLGDQIYEYTLETEISNRLRDMSLMDAQGWARKYRELYLRHWTDQVPKSIFGRTPTCMILDDHDVLDDFGVLPPEDTASINFAVGLLVRRGAWPNRVDGALRAYKKFQHSHNPATPNNQFYFSMKHGPLASFVLDLRTQRAIPPATALGITSNPLPRITWSPADWVACPQHSILGQPQFEAFSNWIKVDCSTAKVAVVASSVPLAFFPVERLMYLLTWLKDNATPDISAAPWYFELLPALAAGLAFEPIAANAASGVTRELVEDGIAEKARKTFWEMLGVNGLLNKLDRDLADGWTWGPHQNGLKAVLDQLFSLADQGKTVVVLSGDVHMGAIHEIYNTETGSKIWQLTTSPISTKPALEEDNLLGYLVEHIQDKPLDEKPLIEQWNALLKKRPTEEELRGWFRLSLIGTQTADFSLVGPYRARILRTVHKRNFGEVEVRGLGTPNDELQVVLKLAQEDGTISRLLVPETMKMSDDDI